MHVTVCICTRNRGSSIATTLRSVAASTYKDFDAVIVDQSTTDETAEAVRAVIAEDERFRYLRSQAIGASAARNVAIAQARGPLIAFTDDDCEVHPEWLAVLVDLFCQYPDAGEVCGPVLPAPHDLSQGYIPTYEVRRFERIRSPWAMWRAGGIGANMAFRLEALRAVGPFDELLGPGTSLCNCEDGDMTYRVLKAGYSVMNTPDASVVHYGFRTFEQGKMLVRNTFLAISAAYMKHVRMGDLAILPTIFYLWFWKCISWKDLLLLRRRSGLGRFLYYSRGFFVSFRYPIDRATRLYRPRPEPPAEAIPPTQQMVSRPE
jgi:glycosyltransferase involved in cell wall biosynthesis